MHDYILLKVYEHIIHSLAGPPNYVQWKCVVTNAGITSMFSNLPVDITDKYIRFPDNTVELTMHDQETFIVEYDDYVRYETLEYIVQ